jgi:chitinase
MLDLPILISSRLLTGGTLFIAASLASPVLACPSGSQFFAYGGAGGCVADGKKVQECFHMGKTCPSGWSNEGESEGKSWCCPPIVSKKQDTPQPVQNETCTWRGTAPICKGRCQPGELGRSASTDGKGTYPNFGATCLSGVKAYCCRLTFPNR